MQGATTSGSGDRTIDRAIFRRGMRLVGSYVRMHPKPFAASVAGAVLFAFASLWLTEALGAGDRRGARARHSRATLDAVEGLGRGRRAHARAASAGRSASWCAATTAGVAGERVMATLRNRVAERYRGRCSCNTPRDADRRAPRAHGGRREGGRRRVLAGSVRERCDRAYRSSRSLELLRGRAHGWRWSGCVLFPSLALMNHAFAKRMQEPARLRAGAHRRGVSAVAHESIDGALVVKTLGRERAETRTPVREGARRLRDERVRAGTIRATFEAALDALPDAGAIVDPARRGLLAGRDAATSRWAT